MKKEELKKKPYVAPQCRIIPMEIENFICTSVSPDVPATTEEDWQENFENGGEIEF